MSTPVTYNGTTYFVPAFGDGGYAQGAGNLSLYLIALATGSLQNTGGLFTLLAQVNFGPTFGLTANNFTAGSVNPATAGVLRLENVDTIDWRNFANSANLALGVNASDQLTYQGVVITTAATAAITALTGDVTATGPGSVAATLATVNSNVGSFTNASITVNGKGLITAASSGTAPVTSVTGTANQIASTGGTTPVLSIASPLILPGVLEILNGTVSAPSLSFASATNTGLYSPSSNVWALSANGVSALSATYSAAFSPTDVSLRVYAGGNPLGDSSTSEVFTAYRNTDGVTGGLNVESCDVIAINEGFGSARFIAYASKAGTASTAIVGSFGSAKPGTWFAGVPLANSSFLTSQFASCLIINNDGAGTSGTTRFINGGTPLWIFNDTGGGVYAKISGTGSTFRGTTTNDNAAAGFIGEYIESVHSGNVSVPGASNVLGDVTSIALTAGDWDVIVCTAINANGATGTTYVDFGIGTASGSSSAGTLLGQNFLEVLGPVGGNDTSCVIPPWRASIATTTTFYFKLAMAFVGATPVTQGYRMSARRVR